jgi:hypothetical protein
MRRAPAPFIRSRELLGDFAAFWQQPVGFRHGWCRTIEVNVMSVFDPASSVRNGTEMVLVNSVFGAGSGR